MNDHSMVRGTVVDRSTGAGLPGARIEAWDASGRLKDLILYARTDAAGRFSMELSNADRTRLFGDSTPSLYFRVFEGATEHVLFEGRTQPLWRPDHRPSDITLRAESGRRMMTLAKHASAIVRGTVASAEGALRAMFVQAFDEHLGELTPLGNPVTTDDRGAYRISYDPTTIPFGKERPDLVVKAFSDEGLTDLIAESSRRCRAPATAIVDLVKTGDHWRGPSRYVSVIQSITLLLGGRSLSTLNEEQRERLACSSGVSRTDLDALASASLLSASSLPMSEELAYGLLRRGLSPERDTFFLHGISTIKKELRAALAANDVTQVFARDLDGTIESQWVPAAAAWALEPRTSGTCGLAEILTAADVLDTPVRMSFAMAYCRHEGTVESFWDTLAVLSPEQKGRTQLAMQWWTLTRGHNPLMQYLKDEIATYPTLKDLCILDEAGWTAILEQPQVGVPSSVPGATDAEKRSNYARVLYHTMAAAFPTTTFVRRVNALDSVESPGVKTFFVVNPTFEFGKTRITQTDMSGLDENETRRVKAMDRLFKLVPRYEEIKTLLDLGYTSAHAIQDKGRGKFVSETQDLLGGTAAAESFYKKACQQAGASTQVLAKYGAAFNAIQMTVLPNWGTPTQSPQNDLPDWQTLFGSAGGCACKHCASVLSASAYLVDLLQWLSHFDSEETKPGGTKWTALDVLVGAVDGTASIPGRRPDLKKLELTCKSSHTPLPYIDLANEILEVAVDAHAQDYNPTWPSPLRTSYDADDLLAGPEIVHPEAHIGAWTAVNAATHPFTLPVDLWAHETNAYLRYVGVSRADLIQALHPGAPSDPAYKKALAKSRLSVRELGYELLGNVTATPFMLAWGAESFADPIVGLQKVPAFLRHAGLSFEQLEELLATRYVNGPTGNGALHPLTGTALAKLAVDLPNNCDVQAATLPALAEGHLYRIHGFLRLARRTGLSITDLDGLLLALPLGQLGVIDGSTLEHVTEALALASRLNLHVADIAAFYADLDTWESYEPKSP